MKIRKLVRSFFSNVSIACIGAATAVVSARKIRNLPPESYKEFIDEYGPVLVAELQHLSRSHTQGCRLPKKCEDCKKYAYGYMLKDEVWDAIAKEDEVLCLHCAQERLKRTITIDDFLDPHEAPINDPLWFAYSLGCHAGPEDEEDEPPIAASH